jgi:hypothetical protein
MKFYSLLLLLTCAFHAAFAQTIRTVIPADPADSVTIRNGKDATLAFALTALPPNAILDSCVLQLTLAKDITQSMLLQFRYPGPAKRRELGIGLKSLYSSNKNQQTIKIVIDNKKIKDTNFSKAIAAGMLKIVISNANNRLDRMVTASFYPYRADADANTGKAPRLIVYYKVNRPAVEWATARGNAQHTAQTVTAFRGQVPAGFVSKTLFPMQVQTDLVSYNNKLYVVGKEAGTTTLYAIDPITRSKDIVATGLDAPSTMPAIDPAGRMYYVSENTIQVIDLATRDVKNTINVSGNHTMENAPVIGKDGSLYLVFSDNIYAYSPYPQNRLLWRYSNPAMEGDKSPVALSKDNTVAYVVYRKDSIIGSIIALNTTTGELIKQQKIIPGKEIQTQAVGMPVLDKADNVYVANQLNDADKLYIFSAKLDSLKVIAGTSISMPVISGNNVFFVKDGQLMEYTGTGSRVLAKFKNLRSVRSLVTDKSGTLFCLENADTPRLFVYTSQNNSHRVYPAMNSSADRAVMITSDGTLYTATTNELIAIRPDVFSGDYMLQPKDYQVDNVVFRGNTLFIPPASALTANQYLIGQNGVIFQSNSSVGATADIKVESGGGISFKNGFRVVKGATLSCKTGY